MKDKKIETVRESDIAEKITELSKKGNIKLEQKIEIFEEFMKTGKKLVGNTTFEGYPIGQWARQIRNSLNRMNDEKDDKVKINPTKEQLEKLESMGILGRPIDSTIDEKIDRLVEWRRKYPQIKVTPIAKDEELRKYARTDEEFSQIQEEYEKMQRYYDYVRDRKSRGKLNEKQMEKCKEGEIGGVFGYSARIEELAKKYGITEKDIDYLLTKFGTLDSFYEMHNEGKIEGEKDKILEERIIRNVVDIDCNSNIGYDNLYRDLLGITTRKKGVFLYSSKGLQKALEELGERDKYVIESIYGLNEGKIPKTLENVGRELGITGNSVYQREAKIFTKLRNPAVVIRNRIAFEIEGDENLTDREKKQIEEIKKNIQLQNGDLSENLNQLKKIQEQKNIIEKNRQESLGLEYLELSRRTYNCLKRSGIFRLSDLENMTEEKLSKVRNLGKKSFEEVLVKMQELGISLKTEEPIVANDERQIKECTEKSKIIQRLLEKQQTIDAQQEEINRLRKLRESPHQ